MSSDTDSLAPSTVPQPAGGVSNTISPQAPGILAPGLAGIPNINEPGIPSINEPIPSINEPGVPEFGIPTPNSPSIPFGELGAQTQGNLTVNRERSHGRTLSVPSLSHSFEHNSPGRSPSPCLSPSSSRYLSPDIGSAHPWGPGSRVGSSGGMVRGRSASINLPTPKKKVVAACQRCRTRKIKCDGVLPACGSCVKAGQECKEVDKAGERDIPRR